MPAHTSNCLGVKLLLRAHRRITLTDAGEAFLAEARTALHHADRARNAAQRAARGETGNVTIGYVSSALAEQPFVHALSAFRASHPDVVIEMSLRLASVLVDALRNQAVDIVVTRGPLPALTDECESFVLARQPLIVVLPQSRRLSAVPLIRLSDLAEDTLLRPEDPPGLSLGHTLRQALADAGFNPRRTMVVNEMSSTIGLVAAGLGVALLPASARVLALPGVAFCELQDVTAVSELMVVSRRHERFAAVRALLAGLRSAA
ncbi:MAG: LysR substrate-binding domain-containing protein [Betaproteobacteria bacterium]